MALTRSLPTQHASGLPILDERRLVAARYVRNADGTPRPGVLPVSTTTPIVTGRASMGYDIAPFNAVTARTTAGAEEIANDAVATVATDNAPGSNSRIDVIWVRAQFGSPVAADASNDVVFGVTKGVAGAVPTKPAIPAGAFEIATAEIPSTATTTQSSGVVITQTHAFTAAVGGVVPVRTATELQAFTAGEGTRARRLDNGWEYERVSGAWEPVSSPWFAFTPTWASNGQAAPSIGAGTLTGRAKYDGRGSMLVRYELTFGQGTSGGSGDWSFSLPRNAHATGRQLLTCWASLAGPSWDFTGSAIVDAGGTVVRPRFPESNSSTILKAARNATSPGGAAGTGIPVVSGQYSYTGGSVVIIEGIVEIA